MLGTMTVAVRRYHAMEEKRLNQFRGEFVDLGAEVTRQGRALRDTVVEQVEQLSGSYGFPLVLLGQSFGAGSFGRRTLCQPLDDIDIYVVLNSGQAVMHDDGTMYQLEGSTPGPFTSDMNLRDGHWISADRVLDRVTNRLRELPIVRQYDATAGMNSKRKSAFIRFDKLNVDITPVVWARFSNVIDRYYMPVGQGSHYWKPTNPKEDQRRLGVQNQAQGGLVLPTIRMIKWWNQEVNQRRLKGIHLEVMVEKALQGYNVNGIAHALQMAFSSVTTELQSICPDPTGLGESLDVNLARNDHSSSITLAWSAYSQTQLAANRFVTGDAISALAAWRSVFPLL